MIAQARSRNSGFRRRRVVGAGRGGSAAGAAPRRRRGKPSPISVPRRAARPRSSRSRAPESRPSTARRRGCERLRKISRGSASRRRSSPRTRPHGGRPVRRHPARCALHRRPAPSAAIPTFPGSRTRETSPQAGRAPAPPPRPRGGTAQARRHPCLLHLLARARGRRRRRRRLARPQPRPARRPIDGRRRYRSGRSYRTGDMRTLPCHWPDPDLRFAGLDGFYAARYPP